MSVDSRESASPSLSDSMSPPFREEHEKNGESSCDVPYPSPAPSTHSDDKDIKPPEGKEFIKRPLNPYMCWVVKKRKEVVEKNPKMKMSDVNALLGDMWKRLSDEERKPYFEESQRSREEHKVLMDRNPHLIFKPVNLKKKPKLEDPKTPKTPSGKDNHGSEPNTPHATTNGSTSAFNGFKTPAPPMSSAHSSTPINASSMIGSSVAHALGVRVVHPTPQHPQAQPQAPPHPSQLQPGQMMVTLPGPPLYQKPGTVHQSLEQYYASLCQPAFPERGELPMTQYAPNFYWEQCQQMQLQSGYHFQ